LRNANYLKQGFFDGFDGVLTPSRYLTGFYRDSLGLDSTPLPSPLEMEDVLTEERDPIFVTVVNPSPEKGVMVVARIAEELGRRRPDIDIMIIEARGSAGHLVRAGLVGGFDLRRHGSILVSPPVPLPRDIYAGARVLLAPSVGPDAAPRVVAEALLNGVPPIVSDRGGLPESCNGAGFVAPIPPEINPATPVPVSLEVVEPWVERIARLQDDEEFYAQESARALEAGAIYRPENLTPRYVEYFQRILE
jgi:glycosyltransferase involved in cell wall biosynthesis